MGPGPRPMMPPRNGGQREKADVKTLKKLIVYLKPYLPAIIVALVCAIGGATCTIIGPDKISELTDIIKDGILTGIDLSAVFYVCITLVAIYVAGAALSYIQQFVTATATQKMSGKLRTDINQKLNRLPLRYFDSTTKGDILSRVTNDVDAISQTLGSAVANLVSAAVLFIGVTFQMFAASPILALTTILSSIVGFIAMSAILRFSQKYFNRKQELLGELNGTTEEVYTNHNAVKAYNAEESEKAKFKKINDEIYEVNRKSQFLSGLMPQAMTFSGNLSYILIFVVGVAFIVNGSQTITVGTLIAFMIYARLFSQPLSTFAQSMNSVQQASAAGKRVFAILEAEEDKAENDKTYLPAVIKGDVEFDDVKFGYSADKTIINDFSAKISAGQKVAIVGPTGAGKTTIVNLLMRFYEVNSGDIRIDGISTKDMKRETVRSVFDMILQDTWLFKGTLRENLVFNKRGVTDEQLDEVCRAVGITHLVNTLKDGYDSVIDESANLSEGQKQQITIARAMIKDAPMLILDEATSNIDTRTELVIQSAMDKLTQNRTSFVIAHRLSTIKNADLIIVMNNGDIVETGTHESLLEAKGFYADLYNSQFEKIA